MFPHCSINCTEGVVKEVYISIVVHCPGKVHSGLLTSTQGHTPLPHQSQVTIDKQLNILYKHNCMLYNRKLISNLMIEWS